MGKILQTDRKNPRLHEDGGIIKPSTKIVYVTSAVDFCHI